MCFSIPKNYMYSTVLIGLLWFNVVHYSSLFQYFFWSTMVPTLVDCLVYLLQLRVKDKKSQPAICCYILW